VRALEDRDINAVLAIQAASPEAAQWKVADHGLGRSPSAFTWVAEHAGSVEGFLVARQAADEFEILNLAVAPRSRRQGVATALLGAALANAKKFGAKQAYLEVRASNSGAIGFYVRHGFQATGRRKGYYFSPLDDALILSFELPGG